MTGKLKKVLLPNLPYLLFVYLFDKLCQAVRLAPGIDASEKLLHIGQGFQTAFASSAPSFHALDIYIGMPRTATDTVSLSAPNLRWAERPLTASPSQRLPPRRLTARVKISTPPVWW